MRPHLCKIDGTVVRSSAQKLYSLESSLSDNGVVPSTAVIPDIVPVFAHQIHQVVVNAVGTESIAGEIPVEVAGSVNEHGRLT